MDSSPSSVLYSLPLRYTLVATPGGCSTRAHEVDPDWVLDSCFTLSPSYCKHWGCELAGEHSHSPSISAFLKGNLSQHLVEPSIFSVIQLVNRDEGEDRKRMHIPKAKWKGWDEFYTIPKESFSSPFVRKKGQIRSQIYPLKRTSMINGKKWDFHKCILKMGIFISNYLMWILHPKVHNIRYNSYHSNFMTYQVKGKTRYSGYTDTHTTGRSNASKKPN